MSKYIVMVLFLCACGSNDPGSVFFDPLPDTDAAVDAGPPAQFFKLRPEAGLPGCDTDW